jgi:hypothetical protein
MSEHDPFSPKEAREDLDRKRFVAQEQQREDVTWLMADPRGRRLMFSWLEFCGVMRSSMTGNSMTFFNEGQRNVGLMLQGNLLQHAAEQWIVMMNEARTPPKPE